MMAVLLLRYMKVLAYIMQLLVSCFLITHINASSCFPSDREALTSFAAGLHASVVYATKAAGLIALNKSWSTARDCCSWEGVTCTPSTPINTSRVTALSLGFDDSFSTVSSATILEPLCNLPLLSTLQLISYGDSPPSVALQIPECLGEQLPLLQHLELSQLNLKGPIPASFSRLRHLQQLDLLGNPSLSGPLLPLLQLPNLTTVSLSTCSFSGPPPTFSTPRLQSLSLSYNQFDNSTVDRWITRLSSLTALTHLDLSSTSISGPIPSSISRLFHLQSLTLAYNSISGPLSESLCELINLTYLDLSSNNFSGPFPPCIGHLSSLEHLDLSSNQFASPIPDEWQNLQNLLYIKLGSSGNSLNGARLPEWLFRLPKLGDLRLTSLGLQSEDVLCSTRLSMLNNTLEMLDLSGNNITGSDVLECLALHNFTQHPSVSLDENPLSISFSHIQLALPMSNLWMRACNLTGFLNDELVFKGHIIFALDLSYNNLVGKIPTNLTAHMPLDVLDLSNNYFTGFDSYGSFQSLWVTRLSHNSIAGDVSTVLHSLGFNCSKPEVNSDLGMSLDLSYNHLVGQIPAFLAECVPNLIQLYLDNNNLTGIIPKNFGKFMELNVIRLNNNHLKGTIPASIMTQNLQLLEVSHNDLEGDLKTLFSPLQGPSNLIALVLAHNRISGSIPPFLGSFAPTLYVIDLSHNNLTGNIPPDLHLPAFQGGYIHKDFQSHVYVKIPHLVIKGVERTLDYVWENFRFLDLSANYHLEGIIPNELGDLSALMQLNLSRNSLAGPIPETFSKLSLLETLDLSFNKLQGPIPQSLSSLTKLSVFNVSYNKALEGPIPRGSQLDDNESYIGDTLLCGYEVLQRSYPTVDGTLTHASKNMTIKDKLATWMDKWVCVTGFWLGIVGGFFGILWLLHGPRLPYS